MRILVIEDEVKVAQFIKKGLEEQSYEVDLAYDGAMGKKLILRNLYDLVILDVILPKENGFEICKDIRKLNLQVPVLLLTALDSTDDKVTGLDAGADDYLSKPFKFRELLARVRALSRRKSNKIHALVLKLADMELSTYDKTVTRKGKKIDLTRREFFLLEFLMKNAGKVLSRSEISEQVWEVSFERGTNVVDVYINYLRNKIDADFSPKLIHTIFGMGYVLKEQKENENSH
jgi:two-component system copper resistance phosphate regulon response regulator CusR